jgi:hypothetical protein
MSRSSAMQIKASKKLIAKLGAVAAAVAAVVVLSASPAYAADASHGDDLARVTHLSSGDPYHIRVYDQECDNHRVWVEWVNYNSTRVHTLRDPDGCDGGPGATLQDERVSSFRVCERTKGCSRWVRGPRS